MKMCQKKSPDTKYSKFKVQHVNERVTQFRFLIVFCSCFSRSKFDNFVFAPN